jgi:hypothetical protein
MYGDMILGSIKKNNQSPLNFSKLKEGSVLLLLIICRFIIGDDKVHYHVYLPGIGRSRSKGLGSTSLLHSELSDECLTSSSSPSTDQHQDTFR